MTIAQSVGEERLIALAPDEERAEHLRPIDWEVCRRLSRYMWRYPKAQVLIVVCAAMIAGVHSAGPLIMTETIRRTIEHPDLWRDMTGTEPYVGILTGAGLMATLGLIFYVVMGVRIRLVSWHAERVIFDLRHDILAHVQRLDMGYFDRTKSGRILSRGTSDVQAIRHAVADVIPRTLIHGLMMVGLSAIMISFDLPLALAIFTIAPIVWIVNTVFRRRMSAAYRAVQESFSRLTATIAESVAGIRVTQAFAREQRNRDMFHAQCLDHRRRNMTAARVHGAYVPIFEVSAQVMAAVIVGFGGWRVARGYMDVSELIGFLLCTGGFFISVIILADLYNTTLRAMAGGERVFALLDIQPTIVDHPDAEPLPRRPEGARVVFDRVAFGYDPDQPVLRDLSFTIEPGQVVAAVGHTGSGKTTIVSLLDRLYEATAGRILLDGEPIDHWTLASLHDQVALVLQDNFLFSGTIADNIRFAKPDASDEEVEDVCDRLGAMDVLHRLPRALDTEVGERGAGISLGQRQLVCFARAMIAEPRLLMLDEATSAVDTFTEHRLQIALERLMEGRTSVVVAHRLSTIRRADDILVLERGELVERGPHRDLVDAGGRYAALYREFIRVSTG